jgi:hypothetical protein
MGHNLLTPSILEVYPTDLNAPCDPIPEIISVLSVPLSESDHSIDLSAPTENIAADIQPCDLIPESNFDHLNLLIHADEITKISHNTSLWSIVMDPPISFSHARHKISAIACLSTFKSVYAPHFKLNLIGDYGVDNDFLVHRI